MNSNGLVGKVKDFYKHNRFVNINANVFLASVPSIFAAAAVSEYMDSTGCCDSAIVSGAAITDWATYLPLHIGLHYKANKHDFLKEDGSLDKKSFAKDVAHVYATSLPSIGLFYAIATPFHYLLMDNGMSGAAASQVSYWGTLMATRVVHTAVGMCTGLFNKVTNEIQSDA